MSESDYEQMKPTFERHKAIILQILLDDPTARRLEGLKDDEVAKRLANWLKNDRIERIRRGLSVDDEARKEPTVGNRLRDLAHKEGKVVRIKSLVDGRKHNFHPQIFRALASQFPSELREHYSSKAIAEWLKKTKLKKEVSS